MKKNPLVSVITPAHNEETDIADAIDSILKQSYQNFEIIVCNDGSTDGTRKIVERFMKKDRRIKLINYDRGHSAAFARNRAIEKAKGEIVTFHDADEVAHKDYLKNLVKHFEQGWDAVANKVLAYPPKTFIAKCIKAQRSLTWDTRQAELIQLNAHSPVGIGTYSTKVFRKLGCFDENTFYFEDTDLVNKFHQEGYKAVYEPQAIEYHKDPSTFGETLRQSRWFGKGIGKHFKNYGTLRPFLIPVYNLFAAGAIAGLLLTPLIEPGLTAAMAVLTVLFNLPLLAYGVRMTIASGDPVHSIGFLPLFMLRNLVKLKTAVKTVVFDK